tara:strand:+ start:261 stop:746 length:486 start_codon:yes stop_codon:yes gene_type:complete
MIQTTAAAFRQDNTIHFSAPIGKVKGIPVEIGGENHRLFDNMEVIDLDRNGKPELRSEETFNRLRLQITEPVLFTSFDSIEDLAEKNETEIVRQQDVRSVTIGEPHYDLAKFIWSGSHKSEVRNKRTLDSLVDEVGAFPRDAGWAIDTANDEFVIFSPKAP